jgi:hypothetical protein
MPQHLLPFTHTHSKRDEQEERKKKKKKPPWLVRESVKKGAVTSSMERDTSFLLLLPVGYSRPENQRDYGICM